LLERVFHLQENQTTVRRELLAGLTTFMTMAYVVVVNPRILSEAGMPVDGVLFATCGSRPLRRPSAPPSTYTPLIWVLSVLFLLQTTLIKAAKMAPRNSPELAMLYDKEKQKGNANRASLAVARKLVAYLMAVDRGQRNFQVVETSNIAA